ncbi:hypothetical protein CIPAW_11G132700 [Carya illinoinensis]|uniref:Uncharacterized protein n=1 Tax=Carya illinoinensis TaxID=32201 RepID=A0A8T1P4I1_CARIL|nr:hypothetical protein CIPAW_11G132700 [Carya illinoinensis]
MRPNCRWRGETACHGSVRSPTNNRFCRLAALPALSSVQLLRSRSPSIPFMFSAFWLRWLGWARAALTVFGFLSFLVWSGRWWYRYCGPRFTLVKKISCLIMPGTF